MGVALAWIPFALAVAVVRRDEHALATFLEMLSLFSFLHQPLTLPLVYGDREQFASRTRLFVWAPLALAAVGGWLLLMHALDLYWLILPAVAPGRWSLHWTAPVRSELGIEVTLPSLNGAQRQRRMLETGMSLAETYASVQAETRETYSGVLETPRR